VSVGEGWWLGNALGWYYYARNRGVDKR